MLSLRIKEVLSVVFKVDVLGSDGCVVAGIDSLCVPSDDYFILGDLPSEIEDYWQRSSAVEDFIPVLLSIQLDVAIGANDCERRNGRVERLGLVSELQLVDSGEESTRIQRSKPYWQGLSPRFYCHCARVYLKVSSIGAGCFNRRNVRLEVAPGLQLQSGAAGKCADYATDFVLLPAEDLLRGSILKFESPHIQTAVEVAQIRFIDWVLRTCFVSLPDHWPIQLRLLIGVNRDASDAQHVDLFLLCIPLIRLQLDSHSAVVVGVKGAGLHEILDFFGLLQRIEFFLEGASRSPPMEHYFVEFFREIHPQGECLLDCFLRE